METFRLSTYIYDIVVSRVKKGEINSCILEVVPILGEPYCYDIDIGSYKIVKAGSLDTLGYCVDDRKYLKEGLTLKDLGISDFGDKLVSEYLFEYCYYGYDHYGGGRLGLCISSIGSKDYDRERCSEIDSDMVEYIDELGRVKGNIFGPLRSGVHWGIVRNVDRLHIDLYGRLYEYHWNICRVLLAYSENCEMYKAYISELERRILGVSLDVISVANLINIYNIYMNMGVLSDDANKNRVLYGMMSGGFCGARDVTHIVEAYDDIVEYWYHLKDLGGDHLGSIQDCVGNERVRDMVEYERSNKHVK